MSVDDDKLEAVARCLAMQTGQFISAHDWQRHQRPRYRKLAAEVLSTIARVEEGHLSGGLPTSSSQAAFCAPLKPKA